MSTVYEGSLRCRKRTWTFQLRKAGGVLVSDDHDVSLNTNLRWGEDSDSGFLDRFLFPASLTVSFTDPGSVIWDDIRTSGKNAFTLRIFDSTFTYEMDLFCRLADAYTPLKSDVGVPITSIIATCGLNRTPNQDALAADDSTLHEVFKTLLVDQIRAQDIQYLFSTRNTRSTSFTTLIEMIRFDDLEYAYKGLGENLSELDEAGNQLTDMCEAFQCVLFNDLYYGRRWVVAQPYLLGLNITEASYLAQLYDRSTGDVSANAVTGQLKTLVATDDTRRGLFDPDYAVRVVNMSNRDNETSDDDLVSIDVQVGSLDEGWGASNNVFWISSNPNTFHQTTEGGYLDDGGESVYQDTVLVEGGKLLSLRIDFEYALEYTVGGSGIHTADAKLLSVPVDPSGVTQYAADGAQPVSWTTVDTTISKGPHTPDANGTPVGSLTWRQFFHVLEDGMPRDARLQLQILGDAGTDFYLHVRNVRLTLGIIDITNSEPIGTPPWPSHANSPDTGGSVDEGPTIEYQREWTSAARVSSGPVQNHMIRVDLDGTILSFVLPNLWYSASSVGQAGVTPGNNGDGYSDLNELVIRERLARGAGGRLIRGKYDGILTPMAVLSALGGRYLPIYLSVDLHTEITEFLVYEELLSYEAG